MAEDLRTQKDDDGDNNLTQGLQNVYQGDMSNNIKKCCNSVSAFASVKIKILEDQKRIHLVGGATLKDHS